jgi:hypothetical protein
MDQKPPRLSREEKTLRAMVTIACRGRHAAQGELCQGCEELLEYALDRLDRCPFKAKKPTCAECPIHCYRPSMREEIRAVMKYAGPRMMFRHPLLALAHLIDGLRYRRPREEAEEKQTRHSSG